MVLIIKPVNAQLTKDKDLFGKSDPYCVIIIGQQKQRTKTHQGGGKKPQWYDTLQFQSNDRVMKVEIYDDDFGKDDFIGQGSVNLNQLYSNPMRTQNQYVDLVCNGKSAGRVLISMQYQGPAMGGNQSGWGNQGSNSNNNGWGNGPNNNQGNGWGNNPNNNNWGNNPNNNNWGNGPNNNGWGNNPNSGWGNNGQNNNGWGNGPNNNGGGNGPNNGWGNGPNNNGWGNNGQNNNGWGNGPNNNGWNNGQGNGPNKGW